MNTFPRISLRGERSTMSTMPASLTAARVAIVSGKGGVGKTTVAAALAIAAARAGKNVLLAEMEDREAFAPIFGLRKLAYTEQTIAPNITGLTVEADEALEIGRASCRERV